jgi:hypothetical protein
MQTIAERLQDNGESVSLSDLRWTAVNGRKDPAIVIQRKGKDRRALATISKQGKFADLYPTWQPIIAKWKAERQQTGKRTNHALIGAGRIPR